MLLIFISEESKNKAGSQNFTSLFFSTNHIARIALDIFIILAMFEKWQKQRREIW